MNEIKYIPATMPGCPSMYGHKHRTLKNVNKKLSWWESDSFYYYPTLLLSAFYGLNYKNLREDFGVGKEIKIYADSGGYQNYSQNAHLNPLKVLEWQEKTADVGYIFDHPVLPNDTKEVVERKQKRTVENAILALNNKHKESVMELHGVLQGHKYKEKVEMFKMYKDILYEFDGFAAGGFGVLSGKVFELTKSLTMSMKVFQDYNKPLHFFGLSGNRAVIMLGYLAKAYNKQITFDSSSFSSGSHYMEYELSTRNVTLSFGRENRNTTLNKLPCMCPVCSVCETFEDKPSNQRGSMLALHNLFQTLEYVHFINCLKDDNNKFREYVSKYDSNLIPLLDFIDLSVKDMSEALLKYGHLFKTQGTQYKINF